MLELFHNLFYWCVRVILSVGSPVESVKENAQRWFGYTERVKGTKVVKRLRDLNDRNS